MADTRALPRIAIVGVGGVFPGACDVEQFWGHVLAGRSMSREVPAGRWPLSNEDAYSPELAADRVYSTRGCFVDDFRCDPEGLAIAPDLLDRLDPMFHLLLRAGRAAWRDTVTHGVDRKRVGIIIGNIVLPTDAASAMTEELWGPAFEAKVFGRAAPAATLKTEGLNRYVAGLPAGILAKVLGLAGGSFTLDAACASSLYALKLAADELRAGRADLMLTGGVSRPDCLYTQMGFSQLRALSPSGRCAPFDAKADGLVVGEGSGIIALKRLEDALRDGDHIYATIAGIGLSNDIAGNLMQPDSRGQLRAMRAAYQQAGWKPDDVDLVECHGTGTPVGDAVEFNSLRALWSDAATTDRARKRCVMGSVKSNVGHLLTAAGAAGLIKVLLAMRDRKLPPTANFSAAARGIDLAETPFAILRTAEAWERPHGHARRAAVSGFGFGGINAHVLLEEWEPNPETGISEFRIQNSELAPIAIVGMSVHFGPWKNLDAFRNRIFGQTDQTPAAPTRWWGSEAAKRFCGFFVDEVSIPVGQFRIPPAELAEMLPQQLLMLQVAADAFDDARLADSTDERLDTGVFIGIGLDFNTTNFRFRWMLREKARRWARELNLDLSETEMEKWVAELRDATGPALNANRTMGALGGIVASRVARAFRVGGPSFTMSSEESSSLRALELGVRALQRGELNVALVGAVDLAGDLRAAMGQDAARTFDVAAHGAIIGEGAGALVLKRVADAVRDGDRIYAVIEGLGAANDESEDADREAMERASLDAANISGDGGAAERSVRTRVSLEHALSFNADDDIGHAGAAAGMASLVKTALCLYHQTIPALRRCEAPRGEFSSEHRYLAPTAAQHWLRDRVDGPRSAGVSAMSVDGNCVHVVMASSPETAEATAVIPSISRPTEGLFLVSAAERGGLLEQLNRLAQFASEREAAAMDAVAREWYHTQQAPDVLCVSFVAESITQLRDMAAAAKRAVESNHRLAMNGAFYSPEPLGRAGTLAFVFPGAGNQFAGMGQDLGLQFPEALRRQDEENDRLASQFAAGQFWSGDGIDNLSHRDAIFGQVSLGTFIHDLFSTFAIAPHAVIGYSLGESTGLFATRAWGAGTRDEMLRRMQESTLFTIDLAGPCDAIRHSWKLGADEQVDWTVGVINRSTDSVQAAIVGRTRVYLLIINTPTECVIGGDRRAVEKLVRDLGCVFHPVRGVTSVHCEAARPVEDAYRQLHLLTTTPPQGVQFYSGSLGAAYPVTTTSAADSIVRQAMGPFDFTKVVERAYADGVRLFVEMGPGGSCTRMIDQILENRPHSARAVCVTAQNNVSLLLRTLAELASEGVRVDLRTLYRAEPHDRKMMQDGPAVTVRPGGDPFKVPPPSARRKRKRAAAPPAFAPASWASAHAPSEDFAPLIAQMTATQIAHARAEESFLRFSQGSVRALGTAISFQMHLTGQADGATALAEPLIDERTERVVALDRAMCMEFAVGSLAKVLGPAFSHVDQYPTRVRLPDEPLMLVDRVVKIEGDANSMTHGRVVTEHDVLADSWYLDAGRIPTCIAVEAGQADLFLSGYLGIDSITKGNAVYRLLDAVVTFHAPLPTAGKTIVYDIVIDHFFRQGETHLFRFHFDATVDGEPFLTMRNGCAGFFTAAELAAGKGIVLTSIDKRPAPGKHATWRELVPMKNESYSSQQVESLRTGNLAACFGDTFARLPLAHPITIPDRRMTLVHRVLSLDPTAGRFGLGQITAEADIHPDDWFLTCHFVDDRVMPGTLMYECCLHTLRIYLMRMGWVGEAGAVAHEPLVGVSSQLKCRGQVTASTRKVQYEVTLKDIGYQDDGTPYAIADALMYGDGKAIVQMTNMSVRLRGLTREQIENLWAMREGVVEMPTAPLFDAASITAFAVGNPSEAFGERYRIFDLGKKRKIARLPGPPFQFLDRIVSIENCEQWKLAAGGTIIAQYDVPQDAWYFAANDQRGCSEMPFAVLLEIALQPCGWFAAYLGSALASDVDMRFRNLGGNATQFLPIHANVGTLTTTIKITNVSNSGGMIIQHFDMKVTAAAGEIYTGNTYFGFFSKDALANQIGIRDAARHQPNQADLARSDAFPYPEEPPFPDKRMRMVDQIELYDPLGGPKNLGFIRGTTRVDGNAWFFKAHFFEDPVWPGSLGLESFLQLLKVVAHRRWANAAVDPHDIHFHTIAHGEKHSWIYRGQIVPADQKVTIEAVVTEIDDNRHLVRADGFLIVDGRVIYQMKDFALTMNVSSERGQ